MTQDFDPPKVIGIHDYEFLLMYPTEGPAVEVRISPASGFTLADVVKSLRHVLEQLQAQL